jgi:hypothetical protein
MKGGIYLSTMKCLEHFTEKMIIEIRLFHDLRRLFVRRYNSKKAPTEVMGFKIYLERTIIKMFYFKYRGNSYGKECFTISLLETAKGGRYSPFRKDCMKEVEIQYIEHINIYQIIF